MARTVVEAHERKLASGKRVRVNPYDRQALIKRREERARKQDRSTVIAIAALGAAAATAGGLILSKGGKVKIPSTKVFKPKKPQLTPAPAFPKPTRVLTTPAPVAKKKIDLTQLIGDKKFQTRFATVPGRGSRVNLARNIKKKRESVVDFERRLRRMKKTGRNRIRRRAQDIKSVREGINEELAGMDAREVDLFNVTPFGQSLIKAEADIREVINKAPFLWGEKITTDTFGDLIDFYN